MGKRRRLLDLAGVRYVVLGRGSLLSPVILSFVHDAGLVPTRSPASFVVLRNPSVLPRAFVTYNVLPALPDPDQTLGLLSHPSFDPLQVSLVEGPLPITPANDAPRGHSVAFVRDEETEVELEVSLDRPGLVVLADSFYPGWYATVDGVPAPIVATNHLFRGVPAAAGARRVRFVYAPASVRWGAGLSILALIVLVALWLRPRRGGATAATAA
jgi:hypothetical protein